MIWFAGFSFGLMTGVVIGLLLVFGQSLQSIVNRCLCRKPHPSGYKFVGGGFMKQYAEDRPSFTGRWKSVV